MGGRKHKQRKPKNSNKKRKNKSRKPKISNQTPAIETASSSSALPPPWIELPGDVTANILQRLGAREILENAQLVCTKWRKVCLDPAMWRVVDLEPPDHDHADEYDLICSFAVDRSKGQLIDLRVVGFCDDSTIHYISHYSSNLQRLTIANCYRMTGIALSMSVIKFPQLEELHLIMVNCISDRDIMAIGFSLPMLKSFSYHWSEYPVYPGKEEPINSKYCNEKAIAIGKTMHNLRHLQLLANRMTNEGLEAILDGCPNLESLDIRGCWGLDLRGALGKRCSQQIKKMRDPSEPISDLEWLGVSGESSDLEWCGFASRYESSSDDCDVYKYL